MPSAEIVIVAVTLVGAAALIGGTAGILHELARAAGPSRRAYRGCHHKPVPVRPPLAARLAAALADGWREMAVAHQLLTGGQTWFQA